MAAASVRPKAIAKYSTKGRLLLFALPERQRMRSIAKIQLDQNGGLREGLKGGGPDPYFERLKSLLAHGIFFFFFVRNKVRRGARVLPFGASSLLSPCNHPSRVKLHTSLLRSQESDTPSPPETRTVRHPLRTVTPPSLRHMCGTLRLHSTLTCDTNKS